MIDPEIRRLEDELVKIENAIGTFEVPPGESNFDSWIYVQLLFDRLSAKQRIKELKLRSTDS